MFCSQDEIHRFYMKVAEYGRNSGTVKCLDFEYNLDTISDYDENEVDEIADQVNCSVRNRNQELLSGNHPKQCSFASDCRTREGAEGLCVCGMDGNFWCRPNWGSSVFDEFWDKCENNDDKIHIDEFNWWNY